MEPGAASAQPILQFRVVLRHISPLIWRRLFVCRETNIAQLHHILHVAFGWQDLESIQKLGVCTAAFPERRAARSLRHRYLRFDADVHKALAA
ncbi:MAG: hypothetical protein EOP82_12790 [Variovorax sp.]|nr:MAG: hypothetical protein EOP82_12790 [Variovorax sp.]